LSIQADQGFLIVFENVTKSFGKVRALNSLSMHIPKGVSGLIGPNGAGKTTSLNLILGLIRPDSGNISVFGLDAVKDSLKIRKRIGVLHEKPYFPPNLTGVEFLRYVSQFYDEEASEDNIIQVLLKVGLDEKVASRQIRTFSAGMVQRLGLAQALLHRAELVILDEPTANLDPLGRIEFTRIVTRINKDYGTSFLISSHILPELEKVCEWVSIIKEGRIADEGSLVNLAERWKVNKKENRILESVFESIFARELKL
jgi:ABC-2 type transport system ATP-binding protein